MVIAVRLGDHMGVELVDQLERAFGIGIDDGDLPESFTTVRTIAALVDTKLVSGS